MIRSSKILASAKGQTCAARFFGICNGNAETTVWAHLNGAAFGKGMGIKAHDILGFYACSDCHAYYDFGHGRRPLISEEALLECILSAVCESYVRLVNAGIIVIPRDPEPKPRGIRPKAERGPSRPLPGTKASGIRKPMRGRVIDRSTGLEV